LLPLLDLSPVGVSTDTVLTPCQNSSKFVRRIDDDELEEDGDDYFDEESPPHRAKTAEGGDFAKVCIRELDLSSSVQLCLSEGIAID
jgi:hypothetical protein